MYVTFAIKRKQQEVWLSAANVISGNTVRVLACRTEKQ
jgi:hypothetical protein